jgi:hypothetical protein
MPRAMKFFDVFRLRRVVEFSMIWSSFRRADVFSFSITAGWFVVMLLNTLEEFHVSEEVLDLWALGLGQKQGGV